MNNNWNSREFERIWGLMIDEPEEDRVTCPYCGETGSQKWFEGHDHPDPFENDVIPEIPDCFELAFIVPECE